MELMPLDRPGSVDCLKKEYSGKVEGELVEELIRKSRQNSLIGSDVVVRSSGRETYPDAKFVFRELVQNCQRGYTDLAQHCLQKGIIHKKDLLEERPVHIFFQRAIDGSNEIHVVDFGYGIDRNHLEYVIGLKRSQDNPLDKYASYFGMGTFSADLIAKTMLVETTVPGTSDVYVVTIDFDFMRNNEQNKGLQGHIEHPEDLLDRATTMFRLFPDASKEDEHFTHVVLYLKDDFDPFQHIDEIADFIADSCPVPFGEWKAKDKYGNEVNLKKPAEAVRDINPVARHSLSVRINGRPILKRYRHTELYDIQIPQQGDGTLIYTGFFKCRGEGGKQVTLGKYWYVISGKRGSEGPAVISEDNNTIGLYVDGFLWDNPLDKKLLINLASSGLGKRPDVHKSYLGEIHIASNGYIHPNQSRTEVAGGIYWDHADDQLKMSLRHFADGLADQRSSLMDIEKWRADYLPGILPHISALEKRVDKGIHDVGELTEIDTEFKTIWDGPYDDIGPPKKSKLYTRIGRIRKLRNQFDMIRDDLEEIDHQTTTKLEKISDAIEAAKVTLRKQLVSSTPQAGPTTVGITPATAGAGLSTTASTANAAPTAQTTPTAVAPTVSSEGPNEGKTSSGQTITIRIDQIELDGILKKFISKKAQRNRLIEKLKRFFVRNEGS
jgi:hypothetical protein